MIDFSNHTALFGGSFSPPHIGHVCAIRDLMKKIKLQKVLILPSWNMPLKEKCVAFEHRFQMTCLAFQDLHPQVEVSSIEKDQQIYYTWDLLEHLSASSSAALKHFVFIIGTDQFLNFEKWSRFPEVLSQCDWIILLRKPVHTQEIERQTHQWVKNHILIPTPDSNIFLIQSSDNPVRKLIFMETDSPEISSSQIRMNIQNHRWDFTDTTLHPSVKNYIIRNQLYAA